MLIDFAWFNGLIIGALAVSTLAPCILLTLLVKDWLGETLW